MGAVKIKTYRRWWPVFAALALVSCDPITPEDRAFFEARERERSNREAVMRSATTEYPIEELIRQVRQSPAPDGDGNVDAWLERQMDIRQGQALFPRWSSSRRGSNKQEISYQFIWIDQQNNMRRMAYSWEVDVLDMAISPPRFDQIEEMNSPDQVRYQQEVRRIREHEKSLE